MAETTSKTTVCPVCDTSDPFWSWTDTHGIAQCQCGTPFRIFHYDDSNKRVPLPPECAVMSWFIPLLRKFREETGCIIPSGFSLPGGQERAGRTSVERFNAWCEAHNDEFDAAKAEYEATTPPTGGA